MSGRAGYDLGQDIGKMMEHKFSSKLAKVIGKTGHIGGIVLLCIGVMMMIFDTELALPGFLIGVGGVALLLLLHLLALKIDKKHEAKK